MDIWMILHVNLAQRSERQHSRWTRTGSDVSGSNSIRYRSHSLDCGKFAICPFIVNVNLLILRRYRTSIADIFAIELEKWQVGTIVESRLSARMPLGGKDVKDYELSIANKGVICDFRHRQMNKINHIDFCMCFCSAPLTPVKPARPQRHLAVSRRRETTFASSL